MKLTNTNHLNISATVGNAVSLLIIVIRVIINKPTGPILV